MMESFRDIPMLKPTVLLWCLGLMLCFFTSASSAQEEYDHSQFKLDLNCWVSSPSGYFNGKNHEGYFDLQRDFGFGDYATFNGRWDWRFKRKHHLMFSVTPMLSSRTTTLSRTITFQDQTFDVGARVQSSIRSLIFTPSYQWDFLRRHSFWVGLLVNVNLAYTRAKLKSEGVVSGGSGTASGSTQASGSLFAPLPAIGPDLRWYFIPHSSRVYFDGTLTAMSFFGYGNFVSGHGDLGFPIGHNWDVRAGYLVGSRYKIYGSSGDIGVRLTQKGPAFGLEYHWGTR